MVVPLVSEYIILVPDLVIVLLIPESVMVLLIPEAVILPLVRESMNVLSFKASDWTCPLTTIDSANVSLHHLVLQPKITVCILFHH